MNKSARATLFLIAITVLPLLFPRPAASGESEDAVASGKKLFADASLGTNGRSCNSCHTGLGKGDIPFTGRVPFPKVFSMAKKMRTLDQTVQGCIIGAMKGSPLAWDDAKLTDLVTYVNTLYQKQ
ncbi:MAG: c-type cytochrome [Candidatus Methylomirabilia bacterium]